jgi:aminoglycoside phosphotransferase (APT) family kinase protein
MPIQQTAPETIQQEMTTVREVVGLAGDHPIELHDGGWDSRVYTFDGGEHFFKFPRSEKIQKRYHYEIAALDFVAGLDTEVTAPQIMWRHPDNAYFGYRGVRGQILMDRFAQLDTEAKQRIGQKIGAFLRQFHTLTLPGARERTIDEEVAQFQDWYGRYADAFQANFTTEELAKIDVLVRTTWPDVMHSLGGDRVLCHGDAHFGNMLIDDDEAVGIIDFGDVGYCDRSRDFLDYEDETIYDATLRAYGQTDTVFKERIAVRKQALHIISVGYFYGKQDADGLARAVASLRGIIAAE